MVAAPPPPPQILEGDLKLSHQNNCGEPEQKHKFGGGAKFKGGPKNIVAKGGDRPSSRSTSLF